ncbi:hypothetical protein VM1G_00667 [Cytospora mali]|uniref:Uncharacterized protein n=1 Tax=Cytospora mali TaxID=578113 RepID=A0A194VLU5_CYTMA|nr:hypothetical protein VM1G_00667 [Valsa mali]
MCPPCSDAIDFLGEAHIDYVFRDDAELNFDRVILAGRSLYSHRTREIHLAILTNYEISTILQSPRGPFDYRPDTGIVRFQNFTLYLASNYSFPAPGSIPRLFMVDEEPELAASLITKMACGHTEALYASRQIGYLAISARIDGSIHRWHFADPSDGALGLYQVQLADLLLRTSPATPRPTINQRIGSPMESELQSSLFESSPQLLQEALALAQTAEPVLEPRQEKPQMYPAATMEAITVIYKAQKDARIINGKAGWMRGCWTTVSQNGSYSHVWVWTQEGPVKSVIISDGTKTSTKLSLAELDAFGEEQFFCMRALLKQDLEYLNSYIASDVVVTGVVSETETHMLIDYEFD